MTWKDSLFLGKVGGQYQLCSGKQSNVGLGGSCIISDCAFGLSVVAPNLSLPFDYQLP